jgi:hypothetical protein
LFHCPDTFNVAVTDDGSKRSGSQSEETLPIDFIIATTILSYGWRVARRLYEHVDEIFDDSPLPSYLICNSDATLTEFLCCQEDQNYTKLLNGMDVNSVSP